MIQTDGALNVRTWRVCPFSLIACTLSMLERAASDQSCLRTNQVVHPSMLLQIRVGMFGFISDGSLFCVRIEGLPLIKEQDVYNHLKKLKNNRWCVEHGNETANSHFSHYHRITNDPIISRKFTFSKLANTFVEIVESGFSCSRSQKENLALLVQNRKF